MCIGTAVLSTCSFGQEGREEQGRAHLTNRLVAKKPASGRFVWTPQGYMIPYTDRFPGTDIRFDMIPVPPTVGNAAIDPFWIGKCEVTWAEYTEYMKTDATFMWLGDKKQRLVNDKNHVDVVTAPSLIYEPLYRFEFVRGPSSPATSMSRFGARQYTKWLSLISDRQYRLPTSREWTHACRAGTKSTWSFGNDATLASEYCVCFETGEDLEDGPIQVGSRKPNDWGIHDMHGNVSEWVLDERKIVDHRTLDTDDFRNRDYGTEILRGGSWEQPLKDCRTNVLEIANRDELFEQDAGFPVSTHWLCSDAMRRIGFRIVSPLNPHSRDDIERYWGPDKTTLLTDLEIRGQNGRANKGVVDKDLPEVIQKASKQLRPQKLPWMYQ